MSNLRSTLQRILLVSLLIPAGAMAQQCNAPQAEGAGEIQSIDLAENRLLVSGTEYTVAITAVVEINGTYGAFTMLEPGMLIEFTYLHYADGERVMDSIQEVDEVELF